MYWDYDANVIDCFLISVPQSSDPCQLFRFSVWMDVLIASFHTFPLVRGIKLVVADTPYPEPVVSQWQSNGNPVCLELRPQCTLECHWRNASVLPVAFQWLSSGLPVCSNYAN